MKSVLATALLAATALTTSPAHAAVIDFEEVAITNPFLGEGPVPNGYAGLNWENVNVVLGSAVPGTGYENGVVSGEKAAISIFGAPATISAPSGTFTFEGGWFTSGWLETDTGMVAGYLDDGDLLPDYVMVFDINSVTPVFLDVSWNGLYMLIFGALGENIAVVDDLRISLDAAPPVESVPEPLTLGLLGMGLLGIAGARQRRKA